jgi:hypothetical protein
MSDPKPYFVIFADTIGTFTSQARTYLSASQQLQTSEFLAPRFALLTHSLELALKAFILSARLRPRLLRLVRTDVNLRRIEEYGENTASEIESLRKQRGHNIRALRGDAVDLGYPVVAQNPAWLAVLSDLALGNFELRYPKPATVYELPSPDEEVAIASEILSLVTQAEEINRIPA